MGSGWQGERGMRGGASKSRQPPPPSRQIPIEKLNVKDANFEKVVRVGAE